MLDNWFFNFGAIIYQQVIGVPMGSDPAPFTANLYVYYHEDRWIWKTQRKRFVTTQKFGNIYHFTDDLAAVNYSREFEKAFHKMYPSGRIKRKIHHLLRHS